MLKAEEAPEEREAPCCTDCGGPLHHHKGVRPGFKGQCRECGFKAERKRDVRRHVGLQGGAGISKSAAIGIFRNPSQSLAKQIKNMNSGKFNANNGLGIGSTTANPNPFGNNE